MEQSEEVNRQTSGKKKKRVSAVEPVDAYVFDGSELFASSDEIEPSLLPIAREALAQRMLRRDANGRIVETRVELFARVARYVAAAEEQFVSSQPEHVVEEKFFSMMAGSEFLPGAATLMNAGLAPGQLCTGFVLPVDDSIESIFLTLQHMAILQRAGSGAGLDFSRIRPSGDQVRSSQGNAVGPVPFINLFENCTKVMRRGGRHTAECSGILRFDHPDIIDCLRMGRSAEPDEAFITAVSITDEFMEAVRFNRSVALKNPRNHLANGEIKARELLNEIVQSVWARGRPRVIFKDAVNRGNPTPELGPLEATSPSGELPLMPYESAITASINVSNMVKNADVDWQRLQDCIRWGVRFLDNVIEVNNYALVEIAQATRGNRKIGLGVMGFADLLVRLGVPYSSRKTLYVAERLMSFIQKTSVRTSEELASQRGVFPHFEKSVFAHPKHPRRNAILNAIAPAGILGAVAGCASGIEPLSMLTMVRPRDSGEPLVETNPRFEKALRRISTQPERILKNLYNLGSLQSIEGVPEQLKRIFETSIDIPAIQHLRVQATFQRYTDGMVAKTVPISTEGGADEVRQIILVAHRMGCKSVGISRDRNEKEIRKAENGEAAETSSEYEGAKE